MGELRQQSTRHKRGQRCQDQSFGSCFSPALFPSELLDRSSKRSSPLSKGLPFRSSIRRSSCLALSCMPFADSRPASNGAFAISVAEDPESRPVIPPIFPLPSALTERASFIAVRTSSSSQPASTAAEIKLASFAGRDPAGPMVERVAVTHWKQSEDRSALPFGVFGDATYVMVKAFVVNGVVLGAPRRVDPQQTCRFVKCSVHRRARFSERWMPLAASLHPACGGFHLRAARNHFAPPSFDNR